MTNEQITCPLCKEEVPHDTINFKEGSITHIWACSSCPFVGIEWYTDEDSINLSTHMRDFLTN